MNRSETLGVVASGAFGPAILALYLLRVLTADLAFAIIGFSFAVALIPGIIENQRKKIGWSKRSCIMTGNNLFAFTVIFLTLGLVLTAISEFVSASMWTVLLIQAFVYAKPRQVVKATVTTDDCGYCAMEPEWKPQADIEGKERDEAYFAELKAHEEYKSYD